MVKSGTSLQKGLHVILKTFIHMSKGDNSNRTRNIRFTNMFLNTAYAIILLTLHLYNALICFSKYYR